VLLGQKDRKKEKREQNRKDGGEWTGLDGRFAYVRYKYEDHRKFDGGQ
jgi:hypothetical protein